MMLFHCCNETPLSELVGKFFVIFARYPGHKNLYNNLMNHRDTMIGEKKVILIGDRILSCASSLMTRISIVALSKCFDYMCTKTTDKYH